MRLLGYMQYCRDSDSDDGLLSLDRKAAAAAELHHASQCFMAKKITRITAVRNKHPKAISIIQKIIGFFPAAGGAGCGGGMVTGCICGTAGA